jgi:hypothetical protein
MTKHQKKPHSLSPRPWRRAAALAGAAVAVAAGLGAAAPAGARSHEGVLHVHPGESVQAAVDRAAPGNTVIVHPGVYRESVRITTSGLTLRGFGRNTVLTPPEAAPAPAVTSASAGQNAAGDAGNGPKDAAGTPRAAHACATSGHGLCVTGTEAAVVDQVTIRGLTLSGFANAGLYASRTDRLTVQRVVAEKNGTWGLAQEKSTRGAFLGNLSRDNKDAGVFIANTVGEEGGALDTQGARIAGNTLTGNRVGINLKRVRTLSAEGNGISGNCAGIFVVSDESRPYAGALTISDNEIDENNKLCPATPRLPAIQGSGIVLTGSDGVVIRDNRIRGNTGTAPMSGGIVLADSFVGATNENNRIENNEVTGNGAADLVHRGSGAGNTFTGNTCASSEPAGLC